jgi:large subunit ribosomal protein L10
MSKLGAKQATVAQLSEDIKSATILVVLDYRGLTNAEMTELRRELRAKASVKVQVAKNTLLRRIANGSEVEPLAQHLKGPTALMMGTGDQVAAIKTVNEWIKSKKKQNEVRAAYLEGAAFAGADLQRLGDLPSREQLMANLLAQLCGPQVKLVMAIGSQNSALVRCLDQIANQKQAS